ncbi:hypothetical protein ACLKA7_014940 [Drosophila subpalustris]
MWEREGERERWGQRQFIKTETWQGQSPARGNPLLDTPQQRLRLKWHPHIHTSTPSSSSSAVALMCDEHPVVRSDEVKPSQDSSHGDKPLKHAYHQCTTNLNDR